MIIKNAYPQGLNIFGLHIQFYAIFILCGALLAFFLASYKAHKAADQNAPWTNPARPLPPSSRRNEWHRRNPTERNQA